MPILHRADSFTALFPRYVSRFRCIGADCEDTCCSGWDISIDQKTFAAYTEPAQAYPPALKKLFKNKLRVEVSPSREKYANTVNAPETNDCPFLQERLCAIHRDIGEDKLSNTCFNFPRFTRDIQGSIEQSLTLSCPEAARQALLQADAFDFVEGAISVRPETIDVITEKWALSLHEMNEIRIFCFQLMRLEGLQTWEKLIILGAFCRELDRVIKEEKPPSVPDLLGNFQFVLESGEAIKMLSRVRPDHDFQAKLFHTIWKSRKDQVRSSSRQQAQDAIAKALGADQDALPENYRRGLKNLPEALATTPYLLDHYVLNEMFREFFPFGTQSAYQNYLGIVFRFGTLRFMLAVTSTDALSLPDRDSLIKTVGVFCRIYQYDSLAELFNQALKEVGWDRLEDAYGLLPP